MNEEKDSRYQLLENNAQAIKALMQAVENTIGPKGLDTMLLDPFGSVTITNDGMTILEMMEVNHPVAKMLINAVRSQQEATGDGTTTTTLLAGEMILKGIEEINKGVPVAQVIKGINQAAVMACEEWQKEKIPWNFERDMMHKIAFIAAREYADIADLLTEAAQKVGREKLFDEQFDFSGCIKGVQGAQGEVFDGVILSKNRHDKQMPEHLKGEIKVLVIDDALDSEEVDAKALSTESGFQEYMSLKKEFRSNLQKIISSGAKLVLVDRGINDEAAEILSEAGIMAISRIPHKELEQAAKHCGAYIIKRTGLKKEVSEIKRYLGTLSEVVDDEKLSFCKLIGGGGEPRATVIITAATAEVVGERERIAQDAASALQAAVKYGLVAGGGASELAVAQRLQKRRDELTGMSCYGLDAVAAALQKPFMQIVKNAGFNPLEKIGDVLQAQEQQANHYLSLDCESGQIADMHALGILDPYYVKIHALKTAVEAACAILRINIIIKKKEYQKKEEVFNK